RRAVDPHRLASVVECRRGPDGPAFGRRHPVRLPRLPDPPLARRHAGQPRYAPLRLRPGGCRAACVGRDAVDPPADPGALSRPGGGWRLAFSLSAGQSAADEDVYPVGYRRDRALMGADGFELIVPALRFPAVLAERKFERRCKQMAQMHADW